MYLSERDILEEEHKRLCRLLKVVEEKDIVDTDFVVSVAAISEVGATVAFAESLLAKAREA